MDVRRPTMEGLIMTAIAPTPIKGYSLNDATNITENLVTRPQLNKLPRKAPPLLTPEELQVMQEISSGLSDGDIAKTLKISLKMLEGNISNIYKKLGTDSRFQAILWAAANR